MGINKISDEFSYIYSLFEEAVKKKVFPGAAMGIAWDAKEKRKICLKTFGYTSYGKKTEVTEKTVYDLASLTKPLATTLSLLCLLKEGKIHLKDRLHTFFPGRIPSTKKEITLASLLCHSSGFPAHRPYFREIIRSENKRETLFALLMEEPLVYETGSRSLYSDLGFMLLGLIIEKISGMSQDVFFKERLSEPLGLSGKIFYGAVLSDKERLCREKDMEHYAFMEECPFRQRMLRGEVSDENAYALGGVAGHAGLFGTIEGVLLYVVHLLDQWKERERHPGYRNSDLGDFLKKQNIPGSTWALGFDTPSAVNSSAGKYLSATSIGHLGFTGTSFWIDPVRDLVVVLLSNRVHPSRENEGIKMFRPLFHDTVLESLEMV